MNRFDMRSVLLFPSKCALTIVTLVRVGGGMDIADMSGQSALRFR